jgi:hypothetical protein
MDFSFSDVFAHCGTKIYEYLKTKLQTLKCIRKRLYGIKRKFRDSYSS